MCTSNGGAKTAPKSTHRVPVGLEIIARAMDPGLEGEYLRDLLAAADRRAARLLTNPLVTLEDEGPGAAVAQLANELGAEEAAKRCSR